ncbi:MAG: LPS export ABC transporter permease LptG [Betaproteobacteria bacterium]|nr:LPS export ABC transporter permease LptG [Betaproteobacteria bacterium]
MKIYERHIFREVFKAILLVLIALIALYAFFDSIESMKDVGRGQFGASHAFAYVGLRLPGRVYELLPIAVLIGALYALSSLARHSEITVLRASGLSTGKLLFLLFKVAVVFAVGALLLGEILVPASERLAQQMRTRAIHNIIAQEFASGLWVRDGRSFVNIRSVSLDTELSGIRIYQFDDMNYLKHVTEAQHGSYVDAGKWRLSDISRTVLEVGRDGNQPYARVEQEQEFLWDSALTPDIVALIMVPPERMSLISLVTYLRHLSGNRQKTERYEIALWKKFFYPASALVMIALAMPFGYGHSRMSGVSLQIFSGVMIGVLFHMLNGLFSSLGILRAWPPLLSAALPSILFLSVALSMLWYAERR